MEEALRMEIDRIAPRALQHATVSKSNGGTLRLEGHMDIRLATRLNLGVHSFMERHGRRFGLNGEVCRKRLEMRIPKVRLGDVTTEFEREVLEHEAGERYSDPNSMVNMPEWNSDFVGASDRRHSLHIKPRYALDDDETLKAVADFVADKIRSGGPVVVHTGAGISAAAGIATYREGSSSCVAISAALPTYTHYAMVALVKKGAVDYVCSQNVDGLHRRSGIVANRLSELHGNSYIETCSCCNPPMEFVRPYEVGSDDVQEKPVYWARYVRDGRGQRCIQANVPLTENEKKSGIHHITGRACPRGGGPLRDSIIHFGESLPVQALDEATARSVAASLNLVLGCSMLVQPAASLPFKGRGLPVLVSLTCTGSDERALKAGGLLLRASADALMERVVRSLGAFSFPNTEPLMSKLHERVRRRDKAVLCRDGDVPYDGGDDGGVVPDELLLTQPQSSSPSAGQRRVNQGQLQLRQSHEKGEDDGWHRWSLQLEAADGNSNPDEVKEVRFDLHPTFDPPAYRLTKPPYKVGPFLGWGTFDVNVEVKLANRPPIATSFLLSFTAPEKVMMLAAAA